MNTRVFLLLGLTTTLAACMSKHTEVLEPEVTVLVTDGELSGAEATEEPMQHGEVKDSVHLSVEQAGASEPLEEVEMDEERHILISSAREHEVI